MSRIDESTPVSSTFDQLYNQQGEETHAGLNPAGNNAAWTYTRARPCSSCYQVYLLQLNDALMQVNCLHVNSRMRPFWGKLFSIFYIPCLMSSAACLNDTLGEA